MKKAALITLLLVLVLSVGVASAVEVTCYSGNFIRESGSPVEQTVNFPGVVGPAILKVSNGAEDDTYERVSSSIIKVNGTDVLTQEYFNQDVSYLESEVVLTEQNVLSIEVRGKPGGKIKVEIVQEVDADWAAVVGSQGRIIEVKDTTSLIFGYKLEIPDNAFSIDTIISIKSDDSTTITTDKREFIPVVNAVKISSGQNEIHASCKLIIPYKDDNNDGIIDDLNVPEKYLQVFYRDELLENSPLISHRQYSIDTDLNQIVIDTDHFSIWEVFKVRFKAGVKVKYYIHEDTIPTDRDKDYYLLETVNAFNYWQQAVDNYFTFERVYSSLDLSADIHILFTDFYSPDLPVNLAIFYYSLYNNRNATGLRSIHNSNEFLDQLISINTHDRRWIPNTVQDDYCTVDFYNPITGISNNPYLRTILHEIGHVMGLPDTTSTRNVCFPLEYTPCNNSCDYENKVIMRYDEPGGLKPFTKLSLKDINDARGNYNLTPLPDIDNDWVTDNEDKCPNVFDPEQVDSDNDGIGDACETQTGYPNIDILTDEERSYFSEEQLSEISLMVGEELVSNGLNNLEIFQLNEANVYFKLADNLYGSDLSNESDIAKFFFSMTTVAKLVYEYHSDSIDDGLNDIGDVLDAFNAPPDNRELMLDGENILPDVLPDNSPTGYDLQFFMEQVVASELQLAIDKLGEISETFYVVWTDPLSGVTVESDFGDVLIIQGILEGVLSGNMFQMAYDLNIDIDSELNDPLRSIENLLDYNSYFLTLASQSYLDESRAYLSSAAQNVKLGIDWILNEVDDQLDDYINLEGATENDISRYQNTIQGIKTALSGPATIDNKGTPLDLTDDTVLNLNQLFSGLNLREYLPSYIENTPIGFLPDPYFNGSLVQISGIAAENLNDDLDSSGTADIFEKMRIPKGFQAYYIGPDYGIILSWDSVNDADEYQVYYNTSGDVTTNDSSLVSTIETTTYFTDIVPGTWYYFKVLSINAAGMSPLSKERVVYVNEIPTYNPTVSVSPNTASAGTTLSEPGYGFAPYTWVTLHFLGPDGSHYTDQRKFTDSNGNYTHTHLVTTATAIGTWQYYAVDDEGNRSNSVYFTITESSQSINPTVSVSPTVASAGTLLNEPGFGFTPYSEVTLYFIGPNPQDYYDDQVKQADSNGNYSHTHLVTEETAIGTWEYYAIDDQGHRSNSAYFEIRP